MIHTFSRSHAVLMALVAAITMLSATTRAQNPRERALYVSVVDTNGEPVNDLSAKDFVVREDRVPREVLRASRADDSIDIALLIDNSTALGNDVTFFRDGLTRFVTALHGTSTISNHIALIGLAQRPTIITDYTDNPAQLNAGIGKVFAMPDSAMTLLDALVETSKGLERREAPRAAIVALLTEGPEHGRYDDRSIITALKKAGTAFHAVTVGQFAETMPEEVRYRLLTLTEGTRQTGGRHDSLLSASGVPQAMEKLGRQLSSEYKVVYGRPDSLIPPENTEVSVTRPGLSARGTPARRPGGQR